MNEKFPLILSSGKSHEYQIKPSKRAKNIRINLSNTGQLSVTLPYRLSLLKAHNFVKSKTSWIEKHLLALPKIVVDTIPRKLNFELLNETWFIETQTIHSTSITLEELAENIIVVTGDIKNTDLVKKLLNKWCQKKCRDVFSSMIETIAEEHGFHFNRLCIRSQKTRWGSCSSNKNISLNSKLLFMPKDIVRYVIIHELCHTIEMNHSKHFWALVEDCDPNFRHHKKVLKEYGKQIVI